MTAVKGIREWAADVLDAAMRGEYAHSTNFTEPGVPDGAGVFIAAIQREIFKRFKWRDEPPNTVGWWLRDRDHPHWERYMLFQIELPLARNLHIPLDLWLKLPS